MIEQQHIVDIELLVMLDATDREVVAAKTHCAACDLCASRWTDAEGLAQRLATHNAPDEVDGPKTEALLTDTERSLRAETPLSQKLVSAVTVLLMSGLLWYVTRRAVAPSSVWAEGILVTLFAVVASSQVTRHAPMTLVIGAVVATLLSVLATGRSELQTDIGLHCAVTEVVVSSMVLTAIVIVYRFGALRPHRRVLQASSLFAALTTAAVLHVGCPAHGGVLHAAVFHGGGIAAAVLSAWIFSRLFSKLPVAVFQ